MGMGQARVAQATFTSCLSNRCQTTRLDANHPVCTLQRPEPGASDEPAFAGFGGASFREPRNRTLRRRRIPRMIGRNSARSEFASSRTNPVRIRSRPEFERSRNESGSRSERPQSLDFPSQLPGYAAPGVEFPGSLRFKPRDLKRLRSAPPLATWFNCKSDDLIAG